MFWTLLSSDTGSDIEVGVAVGVTEGSVSKLTQSDWLPGVLLGGGATWLNTREGLDISESSLLER